jgi:hypothetical protein
MDKPQDPEAAENAQTTNVPAVDLPRLVRPLWFKGDAACDWHEDAGHENGSYFCKCLDCDAEFVGHKRRHICRKCHYEAKARYDALTPEERAAFDEKRNAEIRSFFETNADVRMPGLPALKISGDFARVLRNALLCFFIPASCWFPVA